jgi:hypothetical protein
MIMRRVYFRSPDGDSLCDHLTAVPLDRSVVHQSPCSRLRVCMFSSAAARSCIFGNEVCWWCSRVNHGLEPFSTSRVGVMESAT